MCILPPVGYFVKQRLRKHFGKCRDARVRIRYLIAFNLWMKRSAQQTCGVLGVHVTTIYRVAEKFRHRGEASFWDGRENNGSEKLSEHYLAALDRIVRSSPQDYGWPRPTWTSNDQSNDDSNDDSNDANGFKPRNAAVDFRGQKRTNETHRSRTDPEAKLYRKSSGQEAKLSHMGHVLSENRHGLIVTVRATEASGTAERTAAVNMLIDLHATHGIKPATLGRTRASTTASSCGCWS